MNNIKNMHNKLNNRNLFLILLMVLVSGLSTTVYSSLEAQGRTDGPENSEIGHKSNSYSSNTSGGDYSLTLRFGAAGDQQDAKGSPLMTGIALGYSTDDLFTLELSYDYLYNDSVGIQEIMIGGKGRLPAYPVAPTFALRAGVIGAHEFRDTFFGIVPEVGLEYDMDDKFQISLNGSADFAVGSGLETLWKMFLGVGTKF